METNRSVPGRRRALEDLAAARSAEDAIRGLPWPWWLYTANAILLGAAALFPLLEQPAASGLLAVLVLGLCLFNFWAGARMGAPYAVPRNRGFLAAVALSALFLAGSIGASGLGLTGFVWACAGGTVVSYAVGSLLHYRGSHGGR